MIRTMDELKKNAGMMIMIYGQTGSGKTSALQNLKGKTLIIDLENAWEVLKDKGMVGLEFDSVGKDVHELVKAVNRDFTDWDNIVIDNISTMYYTILAHKAKQGKNDGAPELGHYNQVAFQLYNAVTYLRTWTAKGKNIIINAHEKTVNIIDPDTHEASEKLVIDVGNSYQRISGEASIVGRVIMPGASSKKPRYIQTFGTAKMEAKDRIYGNKYYPMDIQAIIDGKKLEPSKKEGVTK